MPLVGFIHPVTGERVSLDFFAKHPDERHARNSRTAFPPWAAEYIRRKTEEDVRHSGLDLTATRCLACPRQIWIEVLLDWYADPNEHYVMTRGSAMHEVAARYWPEGYVSEGDRRDLLTFSGTLFGVPLSCQTDAVRIEDGALVEIIDTKFPNDNAAHFRSQQRGQAKEDHTFQLNIARHLIAQQSALPWAYDASSVHLTIWDHACGKVADKSGPEPLWAEHWSEERMLAHTPGGGAYTVQQIVETHSTMLAWWRDQVSPEDRLVLANRERACAALPLVGAAGMFNGKKCMLYCGVSRECADLDRRYTSASDVMTQ